MMVAVALTALILCAETLRQRHLTYQRRASINVSSALQFREAFENRSLNVFAFQHGPVFAATPALRLKWAEYHENLARKYARAASHPWETVQWPHDLYGYEQLRIDLDGHCSRRMPIHSGNRPPDFLELRHDGIRIRFDPILARRLQMEEEIEIFFHFTDAEFDDLRRVFDYFNGTESLPAKLCND
jgi:hypothetical protein